MARDIKVKYNDNPDFLTFDINYLTGDLEREETMVTAVYMSLYTDRRAEIDDVLRNIDEKKGWWGDELEDDDQIGSRLWLLDGKTTAENLELAKLYIKECLQWMVDDGVIQKLEVEVERQGIVGNDRLAFQVKLFYSDGDTLSIKFTELWENQFGIKIQ